MTPTNAERSQRRANADLLLDKARSGSSKALGKILEVYRPYLLKIADAIESPLLRHKADPDDLVQETLLEAVASFPTFRGSTEPEFRMWLASDSAAQAGRAGSAFSLRPPGRAARAAAGRSRFAF